MYIEHVPHPYRYSRTQLLLWPEFRASYPATHVSSVLQDLIFTGHTQTTSTHTTHRIFPLRTSASTSAELTKISSTVSDAGKPSKALTSGSLQAQGSTNVTHPAAKARGLDASGSSGVDRWPRSNPSVNGMTQEVNSLHSSGLCVDTSMAKSMESLPQSQRCCAGTDPLRTSSLSLTNPVQNGPMDVGEQAAMDTDLLRGREGEPQFAGENLPAQSATTPECHREPMCSVRPCVLTHMPKFLITYVPKVSKLPCHSN